MSVILEFAERLDRQFCSRQLLDRVQNYLKQVQAERSSAGETLKLDVAAELADMVRIGRDRLKELLGSPQPLLFREELRVLCLATGTGLDAIFGLPDLSDDARVEDEYRTLFPSGQVDGKLYFCGPGEKPSRVDVMRSLLSLHCLKLCLNRFSPGEAGA